MPSPNAQGSVDKALGRKPNPPSGAAGDAYRAGYGN